MAGLHITTSNMMEILVAHLADVIATPLASALAEEIVVINSRGMERWLSMQLAEHHGVCANVSFSFPRPFLMNLLEGTTGTHPGSHYYHPDYLTWKLVQILPVMCRQETFREIRHYLSRDGSAPTIRLYQLASRIAQVLDQYLAYRPEMILNWEAGRISHEDEVWQAELWRRISKESPGAHPPALVKQFRELILASDPALTNIPPRISLIGISALPPLFISMLHDLASCVDVHLFLFNPCREYWSGIMSEREMESALQHLTNKTKLNLSEEDLLLEQGNPLLASMGKVNRDFLTAFADISARHRDFFVVPGEATLLRSLQSDILNLTARGKGEAMPISFPDDDRSIEIHSCHSPMREVEVLYDCLLALFDHDRELQPRDILVMTPDIDTYAPLIESVFDRTREETVNGADSRIPFSIADRKHLRNNPLTDIFFKFLELPESRYEASHILALLDNRAVRNAFGIGEEELSVIRQWVAESGIRWGIDVDNLVELGLPPQGANTWQSGMDKMLLGFALPGENRNLFRDILPYDTIEGERSLLLGHFLDFQDQLFAAVRVLKETHTLKEWHIILDDLVEHFLKVPDDDDWIFDRQHLLDTIHDLSSIADVSGFNEAVSLAVIREHLKGRLDSAGFSGGFLMGGMTFCAMVPMRNIPFKVICLLGMNHQSFPREGMKIGFDLIDRHHRRGDRSKRDDDRYLFLETLLSAREKLIIFYTGQSIRDNACIPPTVVVSELLDYIEQGFILQASPSSKTRNIHRGSSLIKSHLVTEHPLQPFSPGYFKESSGVFSYSEEYCRAAQSLVSEYNPSRPFISHSLPLPADISGTVSVSDLIRFFRHPARFFVTNTLGIRLDEEEEKRDDTELFSLEGLTKYEVEQTLLDVRMAAAGLENEYRVLLHSGKLPLGKVGINKYEMLLPDIERFASRVARHVQPDKKQMPIDLIINDYRLTGQIDLRSPAGFFTYRYAELKGKDYLQAWLQHLSIFAAAPEVAWENHIAGRKEWFRFAKPDHAADLLVRFLDLFREGQAKPIKFFPQTSLQYAKALHVGKPHSTALGTARTTWQVTDFFRGEAGDPCFSLCFGNIDPLDEEFCTLAEAVYNPLLSHLYPLSDSD